MIEGWSGRRRDCDNSGQFLCKYHGAIVAYAAKKEKRTSTFPFLLQLVLSLTTASLLAAGGIGAEGALTHKRGATSIKRSRHTTLLLSALLPLQASSKGTTHCMAQSLPLMQKQIERGGKTALKHICTLSLVPKHHDLSYIF